MSSERKKLHQLFFPIFFEILFTILTGAVDTLMLSSEGDQAVGAVGTANTYISIFLIMFSIISSGMVAVMTQYIGANRPGVARQAMRLGLVFNLSVGAVMTAPTDRLKTSPRRMACRATPGRFAPMYWVITATMPEEMMENMMRKMLI